MTVLCRAGKYAAEANDAEIVDPREYYQGTLRRTLKKYRHIGKTIPAMGYSPKEVTAPRTAPACHTDAAHTCHSKHRCAWWQTVAHSLRPVLARAVPSFSQAKENGVCFWGCRV